MAQKCSKKSLKERYERKRELMKLEEYLVRDRKFFSSYTNDEFIEYELKHIEGITKEFLVGFLKRYGYISINTGSTRIDRDFASILRNTRTIGLAN